CISASSALICSTIGVRRLTSRSCLVPKMARRRTEIMIWRSLYRRVSPRPGTSVACPTGAEQVAGVLAGGGRRGGPARHPRRLLHPLVAVERRHRHPRAADPHGLGDVPVLVGGGGDGRPVGDAQH